MRLFSGQPTFGNLYDLPLGYWVALALWTVILIWSVS